jgi:hypothetical protein
LFVIKGAESFKKHVVKGNLEMFPMLLKLESVEEYHQVSSLVENLLQELWNEINNIFLPFQHQCNWVRNPYSKSSV